MPTHPIMYIVSVSDPRWDGPFILEVRSFLGPDAAIRRAIMCLAAAGKVDLETARGEAISSPA